ncbi:hypothetical protein [Paraliomyxa miuraensis]|uniref:hypothetical protein n=1 Tax=Paraliomyxa miuraensis TaxID=376150 RepID=UPI0022564C81|nr:hypothetical protein [Paraliomyxa miuraensis]MCX4246843.1 hypothetical protein [Paraliomyxa miuraensis]
MPSAREIFLAQVRTPDLDAEVDELRRDLTTLKYEALQQVEQLDDEGKQRVMPNLYEQIVHSQVQLAGHLGLGVSLALTVLDEHHSGASLSRFDRELREQMNEIGTELTNRHHSRLAKMVAQIEVQRLVWRHSHEFMSWLAFRRGDERYPAADRLERLDAFGVQPRLLEARSVVMAMLGVRLSAAIEGVDRFMLGNRWRLGDSPEHALERYVWPILSYLPAPTVRIERARWELDTMLESGLEGDALDAERAKMAGLLEAQLADALSELPEAALAGSLD